MSERRLIAISSFSRLPLMQIRTRTEPKVIEEYKRAIEGGAVFPAVKVGQVGEALVLIDGFHRVAALQALQREVVEAEVSKVASLEEARWEAAKANLTHGLRLKARDRREVFRAYVRAKRHRIDGRRRGRLKSYREMAADLPGMAHTTLRNWMRQDFPGVFRVLGGAEDRRGAPGGLPRAPSASTVLEREARAALDAVSAALPGITNGGARSDLLRQVEAIREHLLRGSLEEEPF